MKGIVFSVIGAVVSGILLLLAQQYLADKPLREVKQLNYLADEGVVTLDKDTLNEISKGTSDLFGRVTITTLTVENGGNVPLNNQEVVIRVGVIGEGEQTFLKSDKILKVATLSFPGKDPESVTQEINGPKISLKYAVLNPGERHRLWLAYTAIGQLNVSARSPGLTIKEGLVEALAEGESSLLDDLLSWAPLIIILFVVGMLVGFVSLYSDLEKRGIDVGAVLKQPKSK